MQLSTRSRYAVMAMVHLASQDGACSAICRSPVALSEIAAAQRLSLAYLEQLFAGLRRARLVVSARGPGGGYRLARPADAVTVAEIVAAVDETLRVTRCGDDAAGCPSANGNAMQPCATHALWHELGVQIHLFLSGITLADIVRDQVAGRACAVRAPAKTPE